MKRKYLVNTSKYCITGNAKLINIICSILQAEGIPYEKYVLDNNRGDSDV